MNQTKLITKLEGFRSRNSVNHSYVNKDVFRLLYSKEIYYIAYNNIKSNDGAETKGSDGTSLHGFCEAWVDEIISSFRDESYQPIPSKTVYIPKKNGKKRKLSFPNGKDKLVQEVIRIILECIYEPTFSNLSHGYRPNRSIHSAISQIDTWRATTWFLEGDISACFDEVDHRVLENILRERINDERFIRLINKLLKAGYLDTEFNFHKSKFGTKQGSICSPILANIYLDKLDRFMEDVIRRDTKGNYRKQNPEYAQVRYQLNKAKQNHDVVTIKTLSKKLKTLSSIDVMDLNFRRVKYVRYADDFLIGIIADKEYAKQLKIEIKQFLEEVLHLRLSEEKTKITNALHDKAHFLGFEITKRNSHIVMLMNIKQMIAKLHQKGLCKGDGYPIGITWLQNETIQYIIQKGNDILRGYLNNNQGCSNYYNGWQIQYIIQFSIAKTIARKYRISMKQVFKKYGKTITCTYTNDKGIEKTKSLALFRTFRRNTDFFKNWILKLKEPIKYTYKDINPLARPCHICGNPQEHMMYHRKKKSLLKKPYPHIVKEMLRVNRRQVCLCEACFQKVGNNELEYNQIHTIRKLT